MVIMYSIGLVIIGIIMIALKSQSTIAVVSGIAFVITGIIICGVHEWRCENRLESIESRTKELEKENTDENHT